MTISALEFGDIPKIDGMLKGARPLMAVSALETRQRANIHRMLKSSLLHGQMRLPLGLIEHDVADVTVFFQYLARIGDMFAVVAAEAAKVVEVADVVRMGPPVDVHLGEKIGLKDALHFLNRGVDRYAFLPVHVRIVHPIEII